MSYHYFSGKKFKQLHWSQSTLQKNTGRDTMYECNSLSIYLWLVGVLTLRFLSQGLSANQNWHALWSVFSSFSSSPFFFLLKQNQNALLLISSLFSCLLWVNRLHELWKSLSMLGESNSALWSSSNRGVCPCYIEIHCPCYFLTFNFAKLYIIWAQTIGNSLFAW